MDREDVQEGIRFVARHTPSLIIFTVLFAHYTGLSNHTVVLKQNAAFLKLNAKQQQAVINKQSALAATLERLKKDAQAGKYDPNLLKEAISHSKDLSEVAPKYKELKKELEVTNDFFKLLDNQKTIEAKYYEMTGTSRNFLSVNKLIDSKNKFEDLLDDDLIDGINDLTSYANDVDNSELKEGLNKINYDYIKAWQNELSLLWKYLTQISQGPNTPEGAKELNDLIKMVNLAKDYCHQQAFKLFK